MCLANVNIPPPVVLVLVATHVVPRLGRVLAVALPQLAASMTRLLAGHGGLVQVLLVRLRPLVFPGGLAAVVCRRAQAPPSSAVGLGVLAGIRLDVHARVAGLGVGRVAAALRLRVKGVLPGQAPPTAAPQLATRGPQVCLLLLGMLLRRGLRLSPKVCHVVMETATPTALC